MIAEWCLGALFKLIDVEHIVILFKALLLEQKVILVCENLGVLSCIMYDSYITPTPSFLLQQNKANPLSQI